MYFWLSSIFSETVGAFGTIAKYIAGINDTTEYVDYQDYVDYGEVHHSHYVPQYQRAYQEFQDYYSDFR